MPVAALPEIKHFRGAREPLSRKMMQVQPFRVAWSNADDKPEFWYPGAEVRFPQSTCAISILGRRGGRDVAARGCESDRFFFLRKLRDMHPGLQKGGAWATCWDQIGEVRAGNGGLLRGGT